MATPQPSLPPCPNGGPTLAHFALFSSDFYSQLPLHWGGRYRGDPRWGDVSPFPIRDLLLGACRQLGGSAWVLVGLAHPGDAGGLGSRSFKGGIQDVMGWVSRGMFGLL